MSGYTPVFDSVFTGSLCGQYPDTAAWLFMLAMADHQGHIDRTPEYISSVTGMPLADLRACIDRFMQPDPNSRSLAEEGRRLVPIDPARPWGWKVVNIGIYRKKAANRRAIESGENATRMAQRRPARTSEDQIGPARTSGDRDSDSYTDTYTDRAKKRVPRKPAPTKSAIPEGFSLTPELSAYVAAQIPDADASGLFAAFADQAKARGWEYADWPRAFQVYVRHCKPNSGHFAAGQYPKVGGGRKWV